MSGRRQHIPAAGAAALAALLAGLAARPAVAAPAESAPSGPPAAVARVLVVEGRVTVQAGAGGEAAAARPLDALVAGAALDLDEGARAWLLVGPDGLAELEGPAEVAVGPSGLRASRPGRPRDAPVPVRRLSGFAPARPGGAPAWSPRPDDGPCAEGALLHAALVSPRETAVREVRPALAWEPLGPVARFDLALWRLEPDGSLADVERWAGLQLTRHVPWRPLEVGRAYLWRVTAVADGSGPGRQGSAWLVVMPADDARALDRSLEALAVHRRAVPRAAVAFDVLEALTLEGHGALAEAAAAWRRLSDAERPGASALAERLARRALAAPREALRGPPPPGVDQPLCPRPGGGAPLP